MVQFFFGTLRNKSELIVDVKREQERGKCFPTRTDKVSIILLLQFHQFLDSTLANVSFQDKVKIKQIFFVVSVEHLTKKHAPKQP